MKSCIRIPRIYIPRQEFEKWAIPTPDRLTRADIDRITRSVLEAPSALRFLFTEREDAAAKRESIFCALDDEWMEKLERGLILIERTTKAGTRFGIVGAIDLEAYTHVRGELAPIRPAQAVNAERAETLRVLREASPLEFPHAMIFYRDKKQKIIERLIEEDLELLYDFELMEEGGKIKGYFVPDPFASWALEEMHTRGEPCFAVAEGVEEIAAAKEHWEALKLTLTEEELENHPARFALAELVNIYDEGVEVFPVHRLVEETEAEALIDYLSRNMKCKREGSVLSLVGSGAETVANCDRLLAEFVRQNGGRISYVYAASELKKRAGAEDTVGVLLKAPDKEDIFLALKGGKTLPEKAFAVGRAHEGRYILEGREISYD